MALKKLYFSVVRDAGLAAASTVIHCVGEHLRARLSQRDYGPGVAWVIIFVNMLEERCDNFRRSHIYEPGKRTVDLDGIEYEIENVVKMLISPDLAAIRSATSVGDVVDALKVALLQEQLELLALNIPDFKTALFFLTSLLNSMQ